MSTVNAAFNGMIAFMLAKFILNDAPHAAGLLANKDLEGVVIEGVRSETKWGEEQYGKKTWAEGAWGRVMGDKITLYHGASEYNLSSILVEGLKPSTIGHAYGAEEDIDMAPEEAPTPAVWLAYTPYLAFFFGDVAIQVTIPMSWIIEANDGVLVERYIPSVMIDGYIKIEDWK